MASNRGAGLTTSPVDGQINHGRTVGLAMNTFQTWIGTPKTILPSRPAGVGLAGLIMSYHV